RKSATEFSQGHLNQPLNPPRDFLRKMVHCRNNITYSSIVREYTSRLQSLREDLAQYNGVHLQYKTRCFSRISLDKVSSSRKCSRHCTRKPSREFWTILS